MANNLSKKKEIQDIVLEMLKKKLTLKASNNFNDTITLQLMLGEEEIGKVELDMKWETDHGHGGGSYVTGLKVI